MDSYHWDEIDPHDKGDRIQSVIAGERITVLRQRIRAGGKVYNPHAHHQEQISIVLEGKAKFFFGDKEVVLSRGGVVVFPPDKEHATENVGNGDLVIEEIFSPGNETLNKIAATPD